jgi:pimeloyl-ACP methyl ester carboxylesterase
MRHGFVEANGVRFHYAEQGAGPLVLLLHGFPECWYSWRHQLPALADAGYRAIAPDMRGYNLTDKPARGYDIETLVADVLALAGALGAHPGERFHLVGHDWGGVVAYQVAWRHPDRLASLAILNVPHPTAFARYVRRHPSQMLRSAYMAFFQVPRLPEWLLTRRRASAIASAFRRSSACRDVFTEAELDVYREAFLRPGAARAAIGYYRHAIRQGARVLPDSPIRVPTMVLWGVDDPVLKLESNDELGHWVEDLTFKRISGCGHWTQQEQPGVVTSELVWWLGRHSAAGGAPVRAPAGARQAASP